MDDFEWMYKWSGTVQEFCGRKSWRRFVSAYSRIVRVQEVWSQVDATDKIWVASPEMAVVEDAEIDWEQVEKPTNVSAFTSVDEIRRLVQRFEWTSDDCIDITAMSSEQILVLLEMLRRSSVKDVSFSYAEPTRYFEREDTSFSGNVVNIVQVPGFQGVHAPDTSRDLLLIGAGYEHEILAQVAGYKEHASVRLLAGLPGLQADMFQESLLRMSRASDALGGAAKLSQMAFAPASDPFVTASVLRAVVGRDPSVRWTNVYAAPLGTRAQVLGFGLWWAHDCRDAPVSLLLPNCSPSRPRLDVGVARVWHYQVIF